MCGPEVRAVTLDVGNTLLWCDPPPPVLYAEAMCRRGRAVDPEQVAPVFREVWRQMQRLTRPGRDRYSSVAGGERAWWGRFLREVLGQLDHDAPWQLLLDDLYEAFARPDLWQVFPEVRSTLDRLRDEGRILAVISNWDGRLPEILERLGLRPYFETVTVSSIEQVEKPAPEIFQRTVARLGLAADQVLHVGDSVREDYFGAAAAGLQSALVDRKGLFASERYRRIEALDGLFELMGAAGKES
jgi:putative hydrolase of the HAD superfamily